MSNPNDSAEQRAAGQAAMRLGLINDSIGEAINHVTGGTRALVQRANDAAGRLSAADRFSLNLVIFHANRRDSSLNPSVGTDALGQTLCYPAICRLPGLVQQLEGIGSDEIVYLPDIGEQCGRIGFMTQQNIEDAAAVLHIKPPTRSEVDSYVTYVAKFKHFCRRAWNAATKEKVQLEDNVDGFALVISHTDLGRHGTPLLISTASSTEMPGGRYRSSMTQRQLAKLHNWYETNHQAQNH